MYIFLKDEILISFSKRQLIEQIRCAENNWLECEKILKKQIENVKDWIPVIRCKDCKFSFVEETMFGYSIRICRKQITVDRQYHPVEDNHYCSHGERNTE